MSITGIFRDEATVSQLAQGWAGASKQAFRIEDGSVSSIPGLSIAQPANTQHNIVDVAVPSIGGPK